MGGPLGTGEATDNRDKREVDPALTHWILLEHGRCRYSAPGSSLDQLKQNDSSLQLAAAALDRAVQRHPGLCPPPP